MKFISAAALLLLSAVSAHPNAARRSALANRGSKPAFALSERAESHQGAVFPKNFEGNKLSTGGPGGFAGTSLGGSTINKVSAIVTVPTVAPPPNAQDGVEYGISAWVGMEAGSGNSGQLWQTGLTISVNTSGPATYGLFYEEYPKIYGTPFSDPFSYGPGDQIMMSVTVGSSTSGTATVENLSTSQTALITMTGLSPIGRDVAIWTLEDFGSGDGSIPVAGWSGPFVFASCSFSDSAGTHGISGGEPSNIPGDTATTITSASGFSVAYTGTS